MSGIEVIGLVLGIIPSVTQALEGYQKLWKKREAFTRKSLHIDRMKHALARQCRLVHSDVSLILRSSDIDAVLFEDEILISGLVTLQRADVQAAVKRYLGVHYHDYMEDIKDCEKVLLEILSTITSVSEGSWNRVKFTMKKDDIDAAIANLNEAVQMLETLRQRSEQLNEAEVIMTARLSKRRANILYGIRSKALMPYRALLNRWNWQTQCHASHAEKLCYKNLNATSNVVAPTYLPRTRLDTLQDMFSLRDMSLRNRVKIAALVATSVTQLHSTPWCSSLGRDSFYFVQDDTGSVDLENPFVVSYFDQNTRTPTGKIKVEAEMELLNLGILILEVWHNSTIEIFASSAQIPLEDTYSSRHDAAQRWRAQCKNDVLPDVHGAAVRCVGCRFDVIDADLEDMKMILEIYEAVVKPLWTLALGTPNC